MSGKGYKRRPSQIEQKEADLRWDLAFCKDEARKADLVQQLNNLKGVNHAAGQVRKS